MRRTIAVALTAFLPLAAAANEVLDLSTRSRNEAAASTLPAKNAQAPFRLAHDPFPELLLREELALKGPRGACTYAATTLCYDLTEGRVVYRKAREFMPRVEGLRAESVSLRHDKVVFKYSFR